MQEHPGQSLQEKIAHMVESNLQVSEEILTTTKKIQRYILWVRIMSVVKILIIVVPIVYGIWFLQPYFSQATSTFGIYSELLGFDQPTQQSTTTDSTNEQDSVSVQEMLEFVNEMKQSGQIGN